LRVVGHHLLQAGVARDAADPGDADLGVLDGVEDREGVVGAGVDVQHGAVRGHAVLRLCNAGAGCRIDYPRR
jgi:hypothetical protein